MDTACPACTRAPVLTPRAGQARPPGRGEEGEAEQEVCWRGAHSRQRLRGDSRAAPRWGAGPGDVSPQDAGARSGVCSAPSWTPGQRRRWGLRPVGRGSVPALCPPGTGHRDNVSAGLAAPQPRPPSCTRELGQSTQRRFEKRVFLCDCFFNWLA